MPITSYFFPFEMTITTGRYGGDSFIVSWNELNLRDLASVNHVLAELDAFLFPSVLVQTILCREGVGHTGEGVSLVIREPDELLFV